MGIHPNGGDSPQKRSRSHAKIESRTAKIRNHPDPLHHHADVSLPEPGKGVTPLGPGHKVIPMNQVDTKL